MNLGHVNKIEVYTEVDFNNIEISDHSIDRALERFNLQNKNRQKVADWIRGKLKHASFKSMVNSERYGIARLYLNDDLGIVLDVHKDVVITIYKIEVKKNIRDKMKVFLEEECSRMSKRYRRKESSYKYKIADLNVEKAMLERKLLRLRKVESFDKAQTEINSINTEIANMSQELCDLQQEISELEISLAAI